MWVGASLKFSILCMNLCFLDKLSHFSFPLSLFFSLQEPFPTAMTIEYCKVITPFRDVCHSFKAFSMLWKQLVVEACCGPPRKSTDFFVVISLSHGGALVSHHTGLSRLSTSFADPEWVDPDQTEWTGSRSGPLEKNRIQIQPSKKHPPYPTW